jgi:UDP-glucuronate 4-epimerase
MSRPVLVTGAAGFIGFHVASRLLAAGRPVVGVDSFSAYYDPALKRARFRRLEAEASFTGLAVDLADGPALRALFAAHRFETVVHLAAQPGVRYALEHPGAYLDANLAAFLNVLEVCRHGRLGHLIFASSSSVYGSNSKLPFAETDPVDHPVSLYAATKRANELMAHSYAHLFDMPTTGLRFFTVYGPWGRPDMAIYHFTDRIARGEPIEVVAGGEVRRDFTYIDDVVEAVSRIIDGPGPAPTPDGDRAPEGPHQSTAPFRLYNIGGDRPTDLNRVLELIETALGRKAIRTEVPRRPDDVASTWADPSRFRAAFGTVPVTPIEIGIERFIAWYRSYHQLG